MARSTSVGRGALALATGQVVAPILAGVQLAVVARVLDAEDLGAWVVPAMALAAIALLLELGLHAVLARRPSDDDRVLARRWALLGSATHVAIALVARAAGARWWGLLLAVVPVTALAATATVGRARLAHGSRFSRAARVELEGALAGVVVACALVVPIGIWALAAAAIARSAWIAARVAGVAPVAPGEPDQGSAISIMAAYALTFVSGNVDYLLAASLLSTSELGVYFLAFNIAAAPATRIGLAANRIVVARIGRSDPAAVVGALLVLSVVTTGAVAALAGWLPVLLGDGWREAIEPVRLLSVGAAAVLVGNGLRGIGIATMRDRRVVLASAGVAALVGGAILAIAPSDARGLAAVVAAAQVVSLGIQATVVDRATRRAVREDIVIAGLWSVVALAVVGEWPWVPLALAVPIVVRHLPLVRQVVASVRAR